jgi:acetyl-CoA carboxylase alpha subunit
MEPAKIYETLKETLVKLIAELKPLSAETLIDSRIKKFSAMGAFTEA